MAKGKKTGGRRKGILNKRTVAKREELALATDAGISPLDFMLNRMRDETADPQERLDAAKAAAPYVHPKLASIEHKGNEDSPAAVELRWGPISPFDEFLRDAIASSKADPDQ